MTNPEKKPQEIVCDSSGDGGGERDGERAAVLLPPRDVPLGGPRAMTVRRTLPQRRRSLIGAWCFVDHYGPDPVGDTGGMRVARHPHTGLATVSWLFTGGIAHLDSAGHAADVRPGEVNLMIAGRGISHQEFSTPDTSTLHGVQLWYALPDATRHMAPEFWHHVPEPVRGPGSQTRVFIGALAGSRSPLDTHTPPLLGAEILLEPGGRLDLDVDDAFEFGVLVDSGEVSIDGADVPEHHLAYLAPGRTRLRLTAGESSARVLLLGGEPLGERIVMWWNFIGRTHEEIVAYREAYQAEIGAEPAPADAPADGERYADGAPYPRFGPYPDGQPAALPAPALPGVTLRPRG